MSPRLDAVQEVLERGLAEGIAPALASAVLSGGRVRHLGACGEAQGRPLPADALFDVASLTKVMATGTLAARLAAAGVLELDAPAARWLPGFTGEKGRITLRHLLSHASGLPAWRPLFRAAARCPAGEPQRPAAAVERALAAEPLDAPPGGAAVYSDLGFIALGMVLERIGGGSLDALCREQVFDPLGLASTTYRPGPAAGPAIVPTRIAETGEVRAGVVHDENARALGGVAGHAGLFSTARDVAALGDAWLEALAGRSEFLPEPTAREFAARHGPAGSTRALAWDTPSPQRSAAGSLLGRGRRGAIGHLGFTGCSLWIDLDRALCCALLTNHCPREGEQERIRAFRRRFHDAAVEALGG